MCYVCNDWQDRNGRGGSSGTDSTVTGQQPSGGTNGSPVAHNPQPYVFLSSHWANAPGRTITWSNATLRLERTRGWIQEALNESQLALVREAFAMWAAVANVKFREIADGERSEIRLGLSRIDGTGGIGGQAQSRTAGGYRVGANIRYDSANYPRSSSVSRERFLRVALHEIGHALGLGHSPVTTSIMYAFGNSTTTLQEDDIAGVRAIFGPSQGPLPRWSSSETVNLGNLTDLPTIRTQTGSVNRPSDEIDHFRFTLDDTQSVGFELRSLSGDAHLYLNDASGRYLAGSFRSGDALDTFVRELGAGTYYVSVLTTYARAGTSNYRLRLGTPKEPSGGTRETAFNLGDLTGLRSSRTRSGSVNPEGSLAQSSNRNDYYRFTLTESRTMRFELRNLSANANLYLETETGRWIQGSFLTGTAVDAIVRTLAAGTYFVRVSAWDYEDIRYQLRYRVQTSPDGQTRATAFNIGNLTDLTATRTRSGTVNSSSNPSDYRRFTLTEARTMRFELRNLSANADLYLESGSGRFLQTTTATGRSVDTIVRTLAAGTYYIRVFARDTGTIRYQLRYRAQTSPDGQTRETAFSIGNLTDLPSTRARSGTVNSGSNPRDYRRFTLTATRTLRFELRNLSANADLGIEDTFGRQLQSSTRTGTAADAVVLTLNAGTYYVRVDARDAGTVRYQLRYRVQTSPDGWTRETAFSIGNLTDLTSTRTRSGTVSTASNPADYRRFTLTEARTLRFELRNLSANADLRLENATGGRLQGSTLAGTTAETIVYTLAAGTWYIRVDAREAGAVRYQLRYRVQTSPDGWTRETAFNIGNLTSLASARTRSGTVTAAGNRSDYRRFTLTGTRTVRLELRNLSGNADLYLEDSSGRWLQYSTRSGTTVDSIVRTLDAGTYYIRVDGRETSVVRYQLHYRLQSTPDGRTRQTAVDLGDITDLASAREQSDTVSYSGNYNDYYRFTLTGTRTVRFELRDLSANADLYLENAFGGQLQRSTLAGTAVDSIVHTLGPGTWYVRVRAASFGNIGYSLRYSRDTGSSLSSLQAGVPTPSSPPLWHADALGGGGPPRPDEDRHLGSTGGILSA